MAFSALRQFNIMLSAGVVDKCSIPMELLGAVCGMALIRSNFSVAAMMLFPIARRGKTFVTNNTFKWLFTGMNALVHLQVRKTLKLFSANIIQLV